MPVKQVEVVVRSYRKVLPLPLQPCDSWMLVKENPDRKLKKKESMFKWAKMIRLKFFLCTDFRVLKEEWLEDSLSVLDLYSTSDSKNSVQNQHFEKQLKNILTNYWQTQYFLSCSNGAFYSFNVPLWCCCFQYNLSLSACKNSSCTFLSKSKFFLVLELEKQL